jgi:hypothetical protein
VAVAICTQLWLYCQISQIWYNTRSCTRQSPRARNHKIVYNFCDDESRGGKSEHRPTTLASPSTLANRELRRTDRKLRGKQVAGNTRRVNNQRCEQ